MASSSSNLARKEIPESELGLRKNNLTHRISGESLQILTTVKRALRLVPSKEIAVELGVSESLISQWLNESKAIPQARQIEILKTAKYFLMQQRTIESHIDALMLMQFGRVDE